MEGKYKCDVLTYQISNNSYGYRMPPKEKVRRILMSKSDMSTAEIDALSDREAWAWVYGHAKSRRTSKQDNQRDQICFTGFNSSTRADLTNIAEAGGLHVVKSVTKDLAFLCIGENAGPSKCLKAKEKNVMVLDEQQFLNLLQNGELPQVGLYLVIGRKIMIA